MKKILLMCAFSAVMLSAEAQTKVIAHRGFWNTENSAQNSITALQKSAEAKFYGSEFDVQLTKDGTVIVNHDDSIGNLVISENTFDKLSSLKLKNGEKIPTLEEYLDEGKKHKDLQLILEIKPHKTEKQERDITEKTVRIVKEKNLENQVEYISFSKNICQILAKLTPESNISYLMGDISPKELKKMGINGIDYYFKILRKKPEWIKEAHDNNMKVNVWTVNKKEIIKEMKELGTDFITTDNPLEAKQICESNN